MEAKLTSGELRELERYIIQRIEDIIFNERDRPSGIKKVSGYKNENGKKTTIRQGGLKIEDKSGKLRRSIKRNKNFIKQSDKGLEINVKHLPQYWKYLDDERKNEDYNWFLTEAIFEDDKISKKIKEVMAGAYKRYIINLIREKTND